MSEPEKPPPDIKELERDVHQAEVMVYGNAMLIASEILIRTRTQQKLSEQDARILDLVGKFIVQTGRPPLFSVS